LKPNEIINGMETGLGVAPPDAFEFSGFVLPDGRLLDLSVPPSLRHQRDFTGRRMAHKAAISLSMPDSGLTIGDVLAAGLIRIVPESGGIQLAGPPTPQQAEILARFIVATNRYGTIVEYGAGPGHEVCGYGVGANPNDVLSGITEYYASREK
jgi:hypothetical protein